MKNKILLLATAIMILFSCCKHTTNSNKTDLDAQKQKLGEEIFFDTNLSDPAGQSCATCHSPETAFSDESHRSISEGAVKGLYGNRNAPTVTYDAYIPKLHYDKDAKQYVGGSFWDGRTPTLTAQAEGPFLNPLEMGNKDRKSVVGKLENAKYYSLFEKIYGKNNSVDKDFENMADAIACYENTNVFEKFNSKYDDYLNHKATLTAEELKGLELFKTKGQCINCHPIEYDPKVGKPLFTDYTYDNLGIPKNPNNPYYKDPSNLNPSGVGYVDIGLGATVHKESENGKFRVQSLRNVALTAPYGHNGYFATLEDIVHFYNVRDVDPTIPKAEYPKTVNHHELGNLGLSKEEEHDIVLFLKTLTDK